MFVHRNIANQALSADINLLSVLQYAVEVLDVKHVMVCGHYQCGGVKAAMGDQSYGLVDYWLAGIRDTVRRHEFELRRISSDEERFKRVVELNVMRQVYNLSRTPVVQGAWSRGRRPLLHGLVYDIHDGLLKPLVLQVDGNDKARELLETPRASIGD